MPYTKIDIKSLMSKELSEIINLVSSQTINPRELTNYIKPRNNVLATLLKVPLKFVYDNYKYFYVDSKTLQRFEIEWEEYKINSHLSSTFGGLSHKDLFQLAEIAPIVKDYENRLSDPF